MQTTILDIWLTELSGESGKQKTTDALSLLESLEEQTDIKNTYYSNLLYNIKIKRRMNQYGK